MRIFNNFPSVRPYYSPMHKPSKFGGYSKAFKTNTSLLILSSFDSKASPNNPFLYLLYPSLSQKRETNHGGVSFSRVVHSWLHLH